MRMDPSRRDQSRRLHLLVACVAMVFLLIVLAALPGIAQEGSRLEKIDVFLPFPAVTTIRFLPLGCRASCRCSPGARRQRRAARGKDLRGCPEQATTGRSRE